MLRLAGIAVSVGLADSLNPSTIGPAVYLATARDRVFRVVLFSLGVFAVNVVAGIALTVGPGRLLLGILPHPQRTLRHLIELAAGVLLIVVAVALWLGRRRLARRGLPMQSGGGRSAFVMGASLAAVELPTAVPYFAVMVATVAAGGTVPQKIGIVTLYSAAFVLPLVGIIVVLLIAGRRAHDPLERFGEWLGRRWPVVLASLLVLAGAALTVLGALGLSGR